MFVLAIGSSGNPTVVNDGTFGILEYYSLYLAAIVVFRVTFAIMHTIKWKWRYAFNKKYQITEYNLEKNFKELKK